MKTNRRLGLSVALVALPVVFLVLETAPKGPGW